MTDLAQTPGRAGTRRELRAAERAAAAATPHRQYSSRDESPTEKIAPQPYPTRREIRSQQAAQKHATSRTVVPRAAILAALGAMTIAVPVLGLDATDDTRPVTDVTATVTTTMASPQAADATEVDPGVDTLDALPLSGPQAVAPTARPEAELPSRAQERTPLEATPAPADPPAEAAPIPAPTTVMPLAAGTYRKTSPYGGRTDPITGGPGFHTGVDLAAPLGTPIYAAADGVVDYVGEGKDGRSSMLIVLKHTINGQDVYTWYNHMYTQGLYVEKGQTVTAGQVIAGVGNNGYSTGPHLHFEVHTDDNLTTTDPLAWLAQQGAVDISLLPATG